MAILLLNIIKSYCCTFFYEVVLAPFLVFKNSSFFLQETLDELMKVLNVVYVIY